MVKFWVLVLCFVAGAGLHAQTRPLTLEEAVREAVEKYPAVRVSLEEVSAAAAGVQLARTSYLPRTDFFGQLNRATRNNVFGLLINQPFASSISGPVLETNSNTNVWGSLVGVLVSWEPFDFGQREANVAVAEAGHRRARAAEQVIRFQVEAAASDAFLTILAADETVKAARAGVERARVLEEAVTALVKAELRPGVDAERARAERALAETQLIQAEQSAQVTRASLAQLLGVPASAVAPDAGRLLESPLPVEAEGAPSAETLRLHPSALEQREVVEEVQARERALDRSFYPRFDLRGTSYARGTGARPDFTTGGAATGLGPNIQNWAVGMSLTFSAFDFASLREKKRIEAHRERAETARYDKILRDLGGLAEKAVARVEAARRIAKLVPVQLQAARAAEQQAATRYRAGLATIVEVADTQRLLTQAEIDAGLANLAIWRSLLALYAARGDVESFVALSGR